jgi:hypothetical protein
MFFILGINMSEKENSKQTIKLELNAPETRFIVLWNRDAKILFEDAKTPEAQGEAKRKAREARRVGCILRNQEYYDFIDYEIKAENLELPKDFSNDCQVLSARKICVEFKDYWKYDPILDKVVCKSGFQTVDKWLNDWSKSIPDFCYDKEYGIWLIELQYPPFHG